MLSYQEAGQRLEADAVIPGDGQRLEADAFMLPIILIKTKITAMR
jgi:hypothetical protein